MKEKRNLVSEALAEFDSKNPMPSLQDTQAIRAWRARRNTVQESASADQALKYQVEHATQFFAKCNNCTYGSAEWIQSRRVAADAARDKHNSLRAVNKAEKEAYVAAAAIYSPPASKQSRDFYAKVVHSNNALPILLSVQKAVDEDPSVKAARASVSKVLANEQPPGKREAWINSDENFLSTKARVKQRESKKSSDQLFGAIAQISKFVEEAEANNPSATVVAQTQSATGPRVATPVVKPKPPKKVARPPVSKLKKRTDRR